MKRAHITLIILSVVFFCSFYLFSSSVKKERFKQVNFDVTVRLQDKIPARFDELWEDLGFFVSPVASVVFVVLLTGFAFWKGKGLKEKFSSLVILVAFGLLVFGEVQGKVRVESPAPPFFMLKNPTSIFPIYHVQEQYSYPSGHAARSIFISLICALLLYPLVKKRPRLFWGMSGVLFLFTLAISIGKIYLGHHWLSDIMGGWILGLASFFLVAVFL